jgi:hypothetical protein
MKISKIQKGLVLTTITTGVFLAGCELIVDFDRTKIPVEISEAAPGDANVQETAPPTGDGGGDGGADAGETDAADAGGDADAEAGQ